MANGTDRTTPSMMRVTTDKSFSQEVGERTDGETPGVGSTYPTFLQERANKANTRNRGPSRPGSAVGTMSAVGQGSRNTAKK